MPKKLIEAFDYSDTVILPPMDAIETMTLLANTGIHADCVMLDPWYNKGTGGILPLPEYDQFIHQLLEAAAKLGSLIYLWGFPEIIGPYVRDVPPGFHVGAWITWYYKNCPSVIRGWRSSQNACIEYIAENRRLYPEHFLDLEQQARLQTGSMRFIPGPPSVIECPLNIGFVGKQEQTGHPAQKPEAVYDKLLMMACRPGDLVIDPMAGSGTTGACAKRLGLRCILSDQSKAYTAMMERRLGCDRISI